VRGGYLAIAAKWGIAVRDRRSRSESEVAASVDERLASLPCEMTDVSMRS